MKSQAKCLSEFQADIIVKTHQFASRHSGHKQAKIIILWLADQALASSSRHIPTMALPINAIAES
jgi:hypothetical protein